MKHILFLSLIWGWVGPQSYASEKFVLSNFLIEHEVIIESKSPAKVQSTIPLVIVDVQSEVGASDVNRAILSEVIRRSLERHGLQAITYEGDLRKEFLNKTLSDTDLLASKIVLDIHVSKRASDFANTIYSRLSFLKYQSTSSENKSFTAKRLFFASKMTTSVSKNEIVPEISRFIERDLKALIKGNKSEFSNLHKTRPKSGGAMGTATQQSQYDYHWNDPSNLSPKLRFGVSSGLPTLGNLSVGYWGSYRLPIHLELSGMYYGVEHRGLMADLGWIVDQQGDFKQVFGGSIAFLNVKTSEQIQDAQPLLGRSTITRTEITNTLVPYVGPMYVGRYQNFFGKIGAGWRVGSSNGSDFRVLFQFGYALDLFNL